MKKSIIKTVVFALAFSLVLVSCAVKGPMRPLPEFAPQTFDSNYLSSVDNFLIIMDASSSMNEFYNGKGKNIIAKEIAARMNQSIPELGQTSGLRYFGFIKSISGKQTGMLYGMEKYNTRAMAGGLDKISIPTDGFSPLDRAFNSAQTDLEGLSGKTAVVIISDGKKLEPGTANAARQLKDKFGSTICFYPVLVGNDPGGAAMMRDIADIGGCGFYVDSTDLLSGPTMARYVKKVFLTRGATPPAKAEEPLDSDNDGVVDFLDKCPNTPKGAKVNAQGCWILESPLFDFDRYYIKPVSFNLLNEVAAILGQNPGLRVIFQGHTDNIGTEGNNMGLSVRRANSVKTYLIDKGVSKQRLSTEGFGFSRPVATNETEEGRSLNRRVEIMPLK
jgi:OOP family OmpA-OmpF porin